MSEAYFTIVNPAAGGGRCARLAADALARLPVPIEEVWTRAPGDAARLARRAHAEGRRRFLAVGGDGTAHEVLNGLFPEAAAEGGRVTLALLPLGTGNSFLRDFTDRGAQYTAQALAEGRRRACDVMRVTHDAGVFFSINLVSVGFAADVAALVNRRFKRLGPPGYWLGILCGLLRLPRRPIPARLDGAPADEGRALFLSVNNSKYTGGTMLLAPEADPCDGLLEVVRLGPIGRMALLRWLPRLKDGSYLRHPFASRAAAHRVDFAFPAPTDVMVDGESITARLQSIEILPGALDVVA